jgi:hypothetical protein
MIAISAEQAHIDLCSFEATDCAQIALLAQNHTRASRLRGRSISGGSLSVPVRHSRFDFAWHGPPLYVRSVRALSVMLLASCVGRQPMAKHVGVGVQFDGAVRGAEIAGSTEVRGWGLSARLHGERLERDEPEVPGFIRKNRAFGLDVGARFSLIGMLVDDLQLVHWLDVGADVGAGGAFVKPSRLETVGRAWVGGWVVLGTLPGNPYPTIVLDVRRVVNDGWDDYTTFTIGLAYSWRKIDEFTVHE